MFIGRGLLPPVTAYIDTSYFTAPFESIPEKTAFAEITEPESAEPESAEPETMENVIEPEESEKKTDKKEDKDKDTEENNIMKWLLAIVAVAAGGIGVSAGVIFTKKKK